MGKEVDRDYEALLENYEDALMRVVMYRVAQEEGKRLLEEAEELERSGFEVPRELDEKCLKLIAKSCASAKRKTAPARAGAVEGNSPHRFRLHKVGQMAVAAILAAILLFGVAYAVNDDFRVSVLNFFLELRENGTQFFFRSSGSGDIKPNSPGTSNSGRGFPFEFTYIPDEYELFLKKEYDNGVNGVTYFCAYGYPNEDSNNFSFEISTISEGTGLFIDTEDAKVTDIVTHGYRGQLVQKIDPIGGKENMICVWFDLEKRFMFQYTSNGILYDESQKILDNIIVKI